MKRLSIKFRVTLWYAIFFLLVMGITLGVVIYASDIYLVNKVKTDVIQGVKEVYEEIEFEDGILEIGEIDYLENGVYISIYDVNKKKLLGYVPKKFSKDAGFKNNEVRILKDGSLNWYIYEEYISLDGYNDIWLRGVASGIKTVTTIRFMSLLCLVAFPILIIIAVVGGYLITRKAFAPIKQIQETVKAISNGKNLNSRIDLTGNEDEIFELAATFDGMLDRLQSAFDEEVQFTSDVSHELRTPVAVIRAQAEYGLEDAQYARESLNSILDQSKKMTLIIQQMLELSRAEQGRQPVYREELNLSELVEMVVIEMRNIAKERQIAIKTDLEDNIYFEGDQTLLMRMVMNLINNAIHYGGTEILVTLKIEDGIIKGAVLDDGIGISEKDQDKVFNRFYQVRDDRGASAGGSAGLGLSMVKWIMAAHQGSIKVQSELGKGSTFLFELKK